MLDEMFILKVLLFINTITYLRRHVRFGFASAGPAPVEQ